MLHTEKTDEKTHEIVDLQLEEEEEKTDEEEEEQGRPQGTLVKVFKFIMKQSYICALIAMMVRRSKVKGIVLFFWNCSFGVLN